MAGTPRRGFLSFGCNALRSGGQKTSDSMEGVLAENRELKEEITALKSENAPLKEEVSALKSENATLKTKVQSLLEKLAWIDPVVSFVRLFKFQSATLGHSFLLLLPLCGVLVALSSLELTDWSSTVPKYNAGVFWGVWAGLIFGGWILAWVGVWAATDPVFSRGRWGGWRHALFAAFPVQATVCGLILLMCFGVPFAGGIDVHFYSLDIVAFFLLMIAPFVVGQNAAIALAVRYFPYPSSEAPVVAKNDSNAAGAPAAVGIEIDAREEKRTRQRVNKTAANKTTRRLRKILNELLAALLPICVMIGCAFRTSPLNRDLRACFKRATLSLPLTSLAPLPATTQTQWPSFPSTRACSMTLGASPFVSWVIP